MDAFEHVVGTILEKEGFWVRTSYKVELTKAEKREIGRPSSPRWELDILAYRPGDNLLRVVECKSYLDSRGVSILGFTSSNRFAERFKLFNDENLRTVVFRRLVAQLIDVNAIRRNPRIQLCLAAGKIVAGDFKAIQNRFDELGWLLFHPALLREELIKVARSGYDNSVAAVTAKLLMRLVNSDDEIVD
jgi:hypothetical protein